MTNEIKSCVDGKANGEEEVLPKDIMIYSFFLLRGNKSINRIFRTMLSVFFPPFYKEEFFPDTQEEQEEAKKQETAGKLIDRNGICSSAFLQCNKIPGVISL